MAFTHLYRSMRRLTYVLWTAIQLAIAFVLLRLVLYNTSGEVLIFPSAWQFLDPLGLLASDGPRLWYTLAIHAALTIGLILISTWRARDASWHPIMGGLMVLPVVRLFVFTALAIAPSARHTEAFELPKASFLDRIIPRSRTGSAVGAILFTLLLILPLAMIDVRLLEQYGLALFIGLPFLLGALSAYLYNHHAPRSIRATIQIASFTILIALFLAFILAMEGLLCIFMAGPILVIISIPGALIGHALAQNLNGRGPTIVVFILLVPSMMAFEMIHEPCVPLYKVVSSINVNATKQEVWDAMVSFSKIPDPDELLFKAGISYPIEARIEGAGVGAIRYCEFNTGPFVEPITVWNEPELLAFDVLEDPPPLSELTFYEHIDAPHVEGFFRSQRGQFRLIENNDGGTLLEGTTWYSHDIWPAWYWRAWSDMILHQIHYRVLEHIKAEREIGLNKQL